MTNLTHPNLSVHAFRPKTSTSDFVFDFDFQHPPEVPLKMPSEFAGAYFDFYKQIWKGGNVIENDGAIIVRSKDLIDFAPEGLTQAEAINMATDLGLASGRLWIRTTNDSPLEFDLTQSGFYLSNRFFLSTVHFTIENSFIDVLKRQGSKRAVITSSRKCVHAFQDTTRRVHLLNFDKSGDISLWELDDHLDLPRRTLSCDDLMAFDLEQSTPKFAGNKIWSVGYACGLGDGETFRKYIVGYYDQMDIQQCMTLEPMKVPNFHEIFPVDRRSLYLGKFSDDLRATDTGALAVEISAWHGLSGAMVGMFVKDPGDSSKWVSKIVGMIQRGDSNEWFNRMISFSPAIKRTITEWIASSNRALPTPNST